MLDTALDFGITEKNFWDMTIAEIHRAVNSASRVRKIEAQEKAFYDYTLANLIAKGFSIIMSDKKSNNTFPAIEDVYGGLFDGLKERKLEEEQKRKKELSIERIKKFAQSHNEKLKNKEVVGKDG